MPRVHVLGNAGIDIVLRVSHAPADGETLIARRGRRAPGGKGLNQAVVAARAGAAVRFQAPVGDDAEGAFVRAALRGEPIRALLLRSMDLATDLSVVIVDAAGGNRIVSTSACADAVTPEDAVAFADEIEAGDVFLVQGNLSREATEAGVRRAVERGAEVVVNLAPFRWAPSSAMPPCHLVVNRLEAAQASGIAEPGTAALALCRAGVRRTFVTLGAEGCLLAEDDQCREIATARAAAIDTTGAGDTFCGMLAAGMASG
ncbi:MAG TPA: PfkB family carbohydrate kinase, partial [Acetobacteraceae bacterium]|nr:PfkB family carbohydrate kinase [Acetobacteraceae bacterium]